ncbi:hypothetical protein D3C76_1392960 [compost metagenome]
MDSGSQTRVHNGQILIGESHVNDHIRAKALNEGNHLIRIISVKLGSLNFCFTALKLGLQRVALLFRAAGNANFLENVRILATLVYNNTCNAAGANNQSFSQLTNPQFAV